MSSNTLKYLDFEILDDPAMLLDGNIVLYGAAEKGIWVCKILQAIGVDILSFADADPNKWGTKVCNIPVLSPQDMRSSLLIKTGKKYVISCIENTNESYQFLSELLGRTGIPVGYISFWGIDFYLYSHKKLLTSFHKNAAELFEQQRAIDYVRYTQFALDTLRAAAQKTNEVLILQPGKVGSTSVTMMLQSSGIPCIQTHRLSYPKYILGDRLSEVWESAAKRIRHGHNKIICLIRDPLSKDYSAFWQSFTFPVERYRYLPILSSNLQEMYEGFLKAVMNGRGEEEKHGISLPLSWREEFDWFDEELKAHLGIDVYQYPFDREKGYTVIRQDSNELFLCKMERLEAAIPALEVFLNTGVNLKLERKNAALAKSYSMAYRAFRRQVKLNKDYINHYFQGNSKVDHFYSEEDQEKFIKKWEDNIE